MPRFLSTEEQTSMARSLVHRVRAFAPEALVYVHSGGLHAATIIGGELGLPLYPLDLRYPLSRLSARFPAPFGALLWPAKEIVYRLTSPSGYFTDTFLSPGSRVALVDDSASSGRTLKKAIGLLASRGIRRADIFVAVLRCGHGSLREVDAWVTDERVVFQRE